MGCSNTFRILAKHSKFSPQKKYGSFKTGLQSCCSIARNTPVSDFLLRETEKIVEKNVNFSMLNHSPYKQKLPKIFTLPLKEGGHTILVPRAGQTNLKDQLKLVRP